MSDVAIRVEHLSKAYRIGLAEQRHETLMGAVTAFVKSPLKNFRDLRNLSRFDDAQTDPAVPPSVVDGQSSVVPSKAPSSDIFWALKDVSFAVKRGEAVGIIGRNGAGKSTLLKILARITEPTRGRAEIHGRVGSLLEVGTGFHPDLTGRENIYLNGTILGMKKREVDTRFDEIVDFSGVEKFIDTPVKRYSSGMRVRLAFSVAAHLEPEVLIVDEVLAVGDAEFQQKCLGKMNEVARGGKTVLFVSHQMAAIESLCGQVTILDSGRILAQGPALETVKQYLDLAPKAKPHSTCGAEGLIRSVDFADFTGRPNNSFNPGKTFVIQIHLKAKANLKNLSLGIGINDGTGSRITTLMTKFCGYTVSNLNSPRTVECVVEGLNLIAGNYFVKVTIGNQFYDLESIENAGSFEINSSDFYSCGFLPSSRQGVVMTKHHWRLADERG